MIQIPLAIKSPELGSGRSKKLISLMELTSIVSCLMNHTIFDYKEKEYIKVLRSAIYNPDFIFLYQKCNYAEGLQAFELFIFPSGYQLAIYSDGSRKLYLQECEVDDIVACEKMYEIVREDITVC